MVLHIFYEDGRCDERCSLRNISMKRERGSHGSIFCKNRDKWATFQGVERSGKSRYFSKCVALSVRMQLVTINMVSQFQMVPAFFLDYQWQGPVQGLHTLTLDARETMQMKFDIEVCLLESMTNETQR